MKGMEGWKMQSVSDGEGRRRRCKENIRRCGMAKRAVTGMVLVCAVLLLGFRPGAENSVIFLDVGQGDCILVQTASGETYLFDCGSTSRSKVGEYVLVPFLKYSGIHRLDAVFISHPDADHTNGILELLDMGQENGVEVCQLVLPDIAEELWEDQFGQLLATAQAAGQKRPVEIRYISAGDMWECGSMRVTCLNPIEGWRMQDANVYSECFYVEFIQKIRGGQSEKEIVTMLLTGDVEGEGEEALLTQLAQRGIEQVDVLKVAHHGSRGATSQELLEQIHPRLSVISCGRNNRYGHPHAELLARLETEGSMIINTAQSGAVTVRVKGEKVSVEGF